MTSAFDAAGTDRVDKMFLDLLDDPTDPNSNVLATVVSYAYVGDDERGAEDHYPT